MFFVLSMCRRIRAIPVFTGILTVREKWSGKSENKGKSKNYPAVFLFNIIKLPICIIEQLKIPGFRYTTVTGILYLTLFAYTYYVYLLLANRGLLCQVKTAGSVWDPNIIKVKKSALVRAGKCNNVVAYKKGTLLNNE